MHNVPVYRPKIRLVSNEYPQKITEFKCYENFISWLTYNFVNLLLVDNFKGRLLITNIEGRFQNTGDSPVLYMVRDEFGSTYSVNEIMQAWYVHRKKSRSLWADFRKPKGQYRKDPVPYTHGWKGSWGKRIHTQQELRRNSYDQAYVRGKRRKGYLPDSWNGNSQDDHRRAKSWKHRSKRKHQWRD